MKKLLNNIKWLSSAFIVIALLTVFWVWPAWNSGSQKWYWGNEGDTQSQMYRNRHAPSGHDDPFEFVGDFSQSFLADEAANQMLIFDDSPWQSHIEWYESGMTGMDRADMGNLEYFLSIGVWSSMTMMWSTYFEAMGLSMGPGSPEAPVVIEGSAMTMSMTQMPFFPGDKLSAMVRFMNYTGGKITVPLAQSCYITSPLSDPGYPGWLPVPTLSQWGVLALAVVVVPGRS